jgi:DNA-binding XRE family transcriptional regulator
MENGQVNSPLPEYPAACPDGNYPALEYARVGLARKILTRREAVGLTQKALAAAAGVRIETVNRVEKGKVTPDTATIMKIDKALKKAESRKK